MKVADLIDDLETGDRSMEHLKSPSDDSRSALQTFRDDVERLMNRPIDEAFGQGLGKHLHHRQNTLNQQMNQSIVNQYAASMQNMQGGLSQVAYGGPY